MEGLTEIKSTRMAQAGEPETVIPEVVSGPITKAKDIKPAELSLGGAVAQNMDKIIGLASDIVEIRKIKANSAAEIARMEQARKNLIAEAEAYAKRKNADTNDTIAKMNIVRLMMQDFFNQNNQKMSGAEFKEIIASIVEQIGKVSNGNN